MGDIRTAAAEAASDFVVPGVPGSGVKNPEKLDFRTTFGVIEDRIDMVEATATVGINWTAQVIRVRSTGNVVIASALENGDTLNGVVLATGNHVFLGAQTAPAENGIYTVVASGAAGRATFADSAAELAYIGFLISEGTVGAGERYTLPLASSAITVGSTALTFARIGVEVSVASEVATARGTETTLGARVTGISDKLSQSVVTVDSLDWSGRVAYHRAEVSSVFSRTDAQAITGFGVAFGTSTAPAGSFNAIYIPPTYRSATGVADNRRWRTVRAGVRTHATDAGLSGATLLAVGTARVDPSESPLRPLHIQLTDPITGLAKTVTPADVAGKDWMVWWEGIAEDGTTKATFSESLGSVSGLTKRQSFYITSGDGRTAVWSTYAGNPNLAFGLALLTDPVAAPIYPPRLEYARASLGQIRPERVNGAMLRRLRLFTSRRASAVTARHHHARIGDSWCTSNSYHGADLTNRLIARYGDGGLGWVGFGSTGGTVNGNARDTVTAVSTGTWTPSYHAGSPSPDLGHATSSSAGAKWTVNLPASPTRSAVKLFSIPTVAGVVRYRWAGGSWTTLDLSSAGSAPEAKTLTGDPGGALALEIEVVSGTVSLAGVDVQSSSDGIIVHKLGSAGSNVATWIEPVAADWQAGIALLGIQSASIMLGTNDQAARYTATEYQTALRTIITRLRTAVPGMDVLIAMPPENQNGHEARMEDYAAAALALALEQRCAFLDFQPSFGDPNFPFEYGDTGVLPLFAADKTHPSVSGAYVLAEGFDRYLSAA